MRHLVRHPAIFGVAPLAGSVDRNGINTASSTVQVVAPLAGSVDRNVYFGHTMGMSRVAPLAGSVDRNSLAMNWKVRWAGRSPRGERG